MSWLTQLFHRAEAVAVADGAATLPVLLAAALGPVRLAELELLLTELGELAHLPAYDGPFEESLAPLVDTLRKLGRFFAALENDLALVPHHAAANVTELSEINHLLAKIASMTPAPVLDEPEAPTHEPTHDESPEHPADSV